MHLYELSDIYRNLLAENEAGEFNDQLLKDRLQSIKEQFNDKAINLALLDKELEAEVLAIKNEVDRLSTRKRVAENKIKWIETYLLENMLATGVDKIPNELITVGLRKAPISVVIIDQSLIPEKFLRVIPEVKEANKSTLIADFKDTGEEQPGVEYITNKKTIQIK
jgi:hypothetical protein